MNDDYETAEECRKRIQERDSKAIEDYQSRSLREEKNIKRRIRIAAKKNRELTT